MPYNLKFSDTKEIVFQKAGTPKKQESNSLMYADSNAEVEVIFNGDKVYQVSIGIAEPEKK
jgi:hypothetical protein